MVLSNTAIRRAREQGHVIIEPFDEANLNTSSYDVTLGSHYFREHTSEFPDPIYNIYDQEHVERVWGKEPEHAKTYHELVGKSWLKPGLKNIDWDDQIILIAPGETILAHTVEFVGGLNDITTAMQARSSIGRNGLEVCRCAGGGDVGYCTRWTMELTNNLQHFTIPLVVGRRIAHIYFYECPDVEGAYQSKYQPYHPKDAQEKWKPQDMLPKLYLDRELVKPE